MRGSRHRLIACFSLLAYLFANTHAQLVLASCRAAQSSHDAKTEKPAGCCAHCEKHTSPTRKQGTANTSPTRKRGSVNTSSTRERGTFNNNDRPSDMSPADVPSAPVCPCCPNDGRDCSLPGGCALCSVAKAPCMNAPAAPAAVFEFLCDYIVEFRSNYVPPFCDGLIRPPRI